MYFKGKEGCPAGGLLCKSKTDFHKAKQVHSVCRGRRLCRLAGSSGFFRKPKANPYALPNTFVGADAHIGPAERTVFTKIFGEFVTASRADVGIGPYRTPANPYCFANFERKAFLPQPFKGSCY